MYSFLFSSCRSTIRRRGTEIRYGRSDERQRTDGRLAAPATPRYPAGHGVLDTADGVILVTKNKNHPARFSATLNYYYILLLSETLFLNLLGFFLGYPIFFFFLREKITFPDTNRWFFFLPKKNGIYFYHYVFVFFFLCPFRLIKFVFIYCFVFKMFSICRRDFMYFVVKTQCNNY